MKPYPVAQVPPHGAHGVARPAMALAHDRRGADLVQRRSARRQPGADRADGRRSQAADVPAAGEDGLQGNRDRLSGGVADRLRLHAQADRRGTDSRRRDGPGADAVARGADRAHVRGAGRRRARDRPSVQLDVDDAAPARVRPRSRRHQGDRRHRRQAHPRLRREAPRHPMVPRVLAGELHRHRARFRRGDLRRGDGRLAADAAAKDHHQPSVDRRARHAQRLRGPDRVDVPASRASRQRHRVGASAQRSRLRHRLGRARADGRGGARRGMPLRQRRAHRQRLPRDARPQPLHAGRRSGDRFLRHPAGDPHRRVLQPAAARPAASRTAASSCSRRSRARTRMRSRRGSPPARASSSAATSNGTCRTCRSIPPTSAAPTTR